MRSSTDRRPTTPEQSSGAPLSDGALTPALAARAEALAEAKRWREVKQLLLAVNPAELERHPRTLFIAADAYARLGHADRAVEMAECAAAQFRARGDEEQYLLAQNLIGAVTLQRG